MDQCYVHICFESPTIYVLHMQLGFGKGNLMSGILSLKLNKSNQIVQCTFQAQLLQPSFEGGRERH